MSVFPLVNPVLQVNFFVTMWDTPDSNAGGVGGVLATIGTAVLNTAIPFLAGGFKSVEGLEASNELETYSEGGDDASDLYFYKRATYPKIVLKRGVTFNTDIWDWHHQVITAKRKTRKSGTIILLDQRQLFDIPSTVIERSLPFEHFPVGAWTFHNALPEKLIGPTLDAEAKNEAIAIETLELRAEKIERLSLALIPGVADLNSAVSGLIGVGGAAATAGLTAAAAAIL